MIADVLELQLVDQNWPNRSLGRTPVRDAISILPVLALNPLPDRDGAPARIQWLLRKV